MPDRPRDALSEFDELADDAIGSFLDPKDEGSGDEKQMVPLSELERERESRRRAEDGRESLIQSMLVSQQHQQQLAQQQPRQVAVADEFPFPDTVDEDVRAALTPVLRHAINTAREQARSEVLQEVEGRYGGIMNQARRDQIIERMEGRVDGFRELLPTIESTMGRMSPQEQAYYNSEAGLEALALRVKAEAAPHGAPQQDMTQMAYSAQGGVEIPQPKEMTEEQIWAMTEAEFNARFPD
jgi:hypothetical protein